MQILTVSDNNNIFQKQFLPTHNCCIVAQSIILCSSVNAVNSLLINRPVQQNSSVQVIDIYSAAFFFILQRVGISNYIHKIHL